MLYFLIVWFLLLISCLSIGILLLNLFKADCFEIKSDRFIVAVWLGVVVLCLSSITVALILPLSPLVGGLIIIGWLMIAFLSPPTRTELLSFHSSLSLNLSVGFLAVALGVAALTTQRIIWFDTGLYHLGSIHWISQFGAVPGIALIHAKLGFTSSWFAFSAPFTAQFLGNRVGAVTNGFVFFLAIINLLIFIYQGFSRNSRLSDWFASVFFGLIIAAYIVGILTGSPIIISFSHDVPINLLIGITAWAILVIANFSSLNSDKYLFSASIIPLILGIGATSIKLTGLPLLLTVFLFYCLTDKFKMQRFFIGTVLIFCLYLPNILFGIVTSGCPLFPSRLMCLNLPWLVPQTVTENETALIRGIEDSASKTILDNFILALQQRFAWLKVSFELQLIVILFLSSLIITIWILSHSKNDKYIKSKIWIIFLGNLGTIFLLANIPLLRMGIGYFILIVSLFFGLIGYQINPSKLISIKPNKIFQSASFLLLGMVLVMLSQGDTINRWLLPSKLITPVTTKAKVNDVEYIYPDNFKLRCWLAELPCSELPITHDIKLRDPAKGISSGFIRAQ